MAPYASLSRRHVRKVLSHVFFVIVVAIANRSAFADVMTYNGGTTEEAEWQTAAGSTSLENFESYGAGTQISSLPALGIGFDELSGGGFPVTYLFGGTPHGPMHLANFPNGVGGSNQFDDLSLYVLPGYLITAFGFWNGDGQGDTLFATAYDALENIIGSVGVFKDTFGGLVTDTPIARIVFDGNTGDAAGTIWTACRRTQAMLCQNRRRCGCCCRESVGC